MMQSLQKFIADSVAIGKLTEYYELNVKKDFDGAPSPGQKVIDIVRNWPHYKRFTKT